MQDAGAARPEHETIKIPCPPHCSEYYLTRINNNYKRINNKSFTQSPSFSPLTTFSLLHSCRHGSSRKQHEAFCSRYCYRALYASSPTVKRSPLTNLQSLLQAHKNLEVPLLAEELVGALEEALRLAEELVVGLLLARQEGFPHS